MKKLTTALILSFILMTTAMAKITFIVPQKPGAGTTVWTEIVTKELQKYLDDEIEIKMIPGARDIPGFNEWHNYYQYKEDFVMVSHGGNGVSFLQEDVDYNYEDYESIALMNLNIIAGKAKGDDMSAPRFAAGSGMVPEAFAMTMLLCGPNKSVDEYISCFKENVTWVSGMSGGERRLAFKRGELNGTRENPAAYKKHVIPNDNAELWFHHGLLDPFSGTHYDDPNYPGYQFEMLFEEKYGVKPSGEFYNSYKLVKSFRDGLQKSIWIGRDNPRKQELIDAFNEMANSKESQEYLAKKIGNYDWYIGSYGDKMRNTLMTFVTEDALKNLVKFNKEALRLKSIYKEDLL